ncbi:MFS transporter [Pseudactinotalea sp. HY160]|uniref:MFS transporter n=1 Tax=Pseudactinotalea sp. HY160 TaxID=2654490 RepID=UPI00128B0D8E|nr:MFS transporter [Pseudactinotalea sp. HY160]MPV48565.1 MFS transporter [Pseudactinotalea sp. HY160]
MSPSRDPRTTGDPVTAGITSLRPLVPGVYLPSLLFEIGVGAVLPMIPVIASSLGADLGTAAFIAALLPIGHILADVPAGALAARFGDRAAMIGSSGAAVIGAVLAGLSGVTGSLAMLAIGVLLLGATEAVYGLARQSYLTEAVHPLRRARAMSTLGGVHRIGLFIGPFAGAGLALVAGSSAAFWLAGATSLAAAAVVFSTAEIAGERAPTGGAGRASMAQVLRDNREVFATLGVAILLIGAVRGARQVVLPLWTESLGYSPAATSLVFGIAGAVDMLLFYPAGKVMDRLGRLWVAIPSMIVMGLTLLALPLATTFASICVIAVVLGFGNGIGSGILMTLGADTAPAEQRSQYLGIWRVFADSGSATGPLIVSAGAAAGSLAAGIMAVGVLSAGTVAALARWVPRWSVHANRRTRREAGIEPGAP